MHYRNCNGSDTPWSGVSSRNGRKSFSLPSSLEQSRPNDQLRRSRLTHTCLPSLLGVGGGMRFPEFWKGVEGTRKSCFISLPIPPNPRPPTSQRVSFSAAEMATSSSREWRVLGLSIFSGKVFKWESRPLCSVLSPFSSYP